SVSPRGICDMPPVTPPATMSASPAAPPNGEEHGAPVSLGWSLGLRATNAADVITRVERGFSTTALDRLRRRLGLSADEIADVIGTSPRTLARRRRAGRLDAAESDRLYRLARLFERAVEVFGGGADGEDDARRWFHAPQWALGGETPLAYART